MAKSTLLCFFFITSFFSALSQELSLPYDYEFSYYSEFSPFQKTEGQFLAVYQFYRKYKENIVYKNAPFKGLYFDMSDRLKDHRFFQEVAFGMGAFTWDFKEAGNRKVSGLLFGKPLYLGWDFKLQNQLYITAGTTLLETHRFYDHTSKTMLFNTFWGLSGKFNINN